MVSWAAAPSAMLRATPVSLIRCLEAILNQTFGVFIFASAAECSKSIMPQTNLKMYKHLPIITSQIVIQIKFNTLEMKQNNKSHI